MFVFYDTETTGIDVSFDQVVQFSAILTDENFQEVDRLDIKCRVLPWIIPSPKALLVTNTTPSMLCDASRPSFFEMMGIIQAKLASWSPATFIGYNSIRFDETFVHRALWQSLYEPYLTVTNGNSRSDLLPILRAVAHFSPDIFYWPRNEAGKIVFRLDQVAPLNGFDHSNAHDALADVEATIFLARQLAEAAPAFWASAMMRSSKSGVSSVLAAETPVLVFEHIAGQPSAWFGQQIDSKNLSSRDAIIARLGFDWSSVFSKDSEEALAIIRDTPGIIRNLRLNKAPVIFSTEEAELLFSLKPSSAELEQSITLRSRPDLWAKARIETRDDAFKELGGELEQRIYEGFPSRSDQNLMTAFQLSSAIGRVEISDKFEDQRFRLLAKRIVFVATPELLNGREAERIEEGISIRRNGIAGKKVPWRTIGDAEDELRPLYDDPSFSIEQLRAIGEWLEQMKRHGLSSKLSTPTPI